MKRQRFLIICLLLLAAIATALLAPVPVQARISGEIDLGYVNYQADEQGRRVTDAHSFRHRYSLLYSTDGLLYDGRVGAYNVSVGYEWGAFDTKIQQPADRGGDFNPSISAGHVLYNGEVVLDPLELPLRMKAYSYDLNRISMQEDTLSVGDTNMIRPGLITDLLDGTHINSGVTLLFGVKNGLTNGYNAIFRHIPLVMIDYRDEINKDTRSATPQDTRLRRLAFVSLNKRDNWFHYRTITYDDYLNPNQSYKESQFQLGTIDQALSRRWIDLTNWLKISTDGQFTKHATPDPTTTFQAYEFNFYALANRETWEGRTFSSLSRVLDQQGITLERTIPVYASGTWGPEIDWKGSLYSHDKRLRQPDGTVTDTTDLSGTLRTDMLKRSPFTLGTTLKAEHADNDGSKLISLEGGLESASTRRFSRDYTLYSSYYLKYFNASNDTSDDTSYLNHDAIVRLAYAPSTTYRLELEEDVSAGSGTNPQDFSNSAIVVNSGFNGYNSSSTLGSIFQRRDNTINNYVRYVTTAGGYWSPTPRARFSLTLIEDILTQPGAATDYLTTVRNTIDYNIADFMMRLRTSYSFRNVDGETLDLLESQGTVEYRPNRNLQASLNYIYNTGKSDIKTESRFIDLRQCLSYNFYTYRGMERKLLEVSEEFSYTQTKNYGDLSTTQDTARRLTLGLRYYPLSRLFIAGNVRFSLLDPGATLEQVYNGTIGVTFQKLQATLDYSYGRRNDSDNRVEKRLAANLRKFF